MRISLLVNLVKAAREAIDELQLEDVTEYEMQRLLERLVFDLADMASEEPAELLLKWFGDRAAITSKLRKLQGRGAFDEIVLDLEAEGQTPVERYLNLRHIAKLAAYRAEAIEMEAIAEACDRFSKNGDSHVVARGEGKGKLVLAFRKETPRTSEVEKLSQLGLALKQEQQQLMRRHSPKLVSLKSQIETLQEKIEELINNDKTQQIEAEITETQESLAYKVAELRFYPEPEEF
ncbi:MAG: hypothetical protein F6J93_27690 [Oscillatoria sp. SIO1A7]|nr:hypothetical protein [Oscillatoria sp. SIO1A7]